MSPTVYRVECPSDGALFVMPMPSSEFLVDDIQAHQANGINKIISLLARDEAIDLGLRQERDCCVRHGIAFVNLPIQDFGLPDPNDFAELVRQTHSDLTNGSKVIVHCRGGKGRSGLFACCVLQHFDLTADDAISMVSSARGVTVPETEAQRQFVQRYLPNA